MSPVIFVMVLFGCSKGGLTCQPVMTLPAAYASEAQCNAERGTMIAASASLGYPSIVAECRPRNAPQQSAPETIAASTAA